MKYRKNYDPSSVYRMGPSAIATIGKPLNEQSIARFQKYVDDSEITLEQIKAFKNLRPSELAEISNIYSDGLKEAIQRFRDKIPPPKVGDQCVRVIDANDLNDVLSCSQMKGYFTEAVDLDGISKPTDMFEALRLDHLDPSDGYIEIRWDAYDGFDKQFGVPGEDLIDDWDYYTANGFTSSRDGRIIPEYRMAKEVNIPEGAELFQVDSSGTRVKTHEFINGVWDDDF